MTSEAGGPAAGAAPLAELNAALLGCAPEELSACIALLVRQVTVRAMWIQGVATVLEAVRDQGGPRSRVAVRRRLARLTTATQDQAEDLVRVAQLVDELGAGLEQARRAQRVGDEGQAAAALATWHSVCGRVALGLHELFRAEVLAPSTGVSSSSGSAAAFSAARVPTTPRNLPMSSGGGRRSIGPGDPRVGIGRVGGLLTNALHELSGWRRSLGFARPDLSQDPPVDESLPRAERGRLIDPALVESTDPSSSDLSSVSPANYLDQMGSIQSANRPPDQLDLGAGAGWAGLPGWMAGPLGSASADTGDPPPAGSAGPSSEPLGLSRLLGAGGTAVGGAAAVVKSGPMMPMAPVPPSGGREPVDRHAAEVARGTEEEWLEVDTQVGAGWEL